MPRIQPVDPDRAPAPVRAAHEAGLARWGRMTNMKRTLLHSLPAYQALMQWYPLFDGITPFLGDRLAVVFAHAVSAESDCLVCTTFMRRLLLDGGEDPGRLDLDERGQALVDLGRAVSRQGNRVPDELWARLRPHFDDGQLVALVSFAALMLATNVVNNVLEVDLDEYLYAYRADAAEEARA